MIQRLVQQTFSRRIVAASLGASVLFLLLAVLPAPSSINRLSQGDIVNQILSANPNNQPAVAQRFDINRVWQQVYEQLPDLPLENQYINQETGEVDTDNTLVGRFIRYHIYVKGRPPIYRLDWKLSLADYLGVNERMIDSAYPSADTLEINPMQGDLSAIKSLNRSQRNALVNTLTDIFSSAYRSSPPSSPQDSHSTSSPSPQPVPNQNSTTSPRPRSPQPGDAELLLP